jgi:hypothetical protein
MYTVHQDPAHTPVNSTHLHRRENSWRRVVVAVLWCLLHVCASRCARLKVEICLYFGRTVFVAQKNI